MHHMVNSQEIHSKYKDKYDHNFLDNSYKLKINKFHMVNDDVVND